MEVKRSLLNHFKQLQQGLAQAHAEAFINVQTFVVEVRLQNKVYRLYPQFVARIEGKKVYTAQFSPDVLRFSGWRPYFDRAVPELAQKLKFKALLSQHGFATPPFATNANTDLTDVIVKKSRSSFGAQIRGPFASASQYKLDIAADEYYEKFILGDIVKIWFWNTQPVRLEKKAMPRIVGNGRANISRLAQKRMRRKKMPPWERLSELLAFYGRNLETVLAPKETQIVDFRYTSIFSRPKDIEETDLLADTGGFAELPKLAQVFCSTLPADIREHVVYSIDAILDGENKLWFLEVNFNPFVHPSVYPLMIASLHNSSEYQELRVAPGVH